MPDITMCANHKCEKRTECYRYMAVASLWQSWTSFDPSTMNCFVPVKKGDNVHEKTSKS